MVIWTVMRPVSIPRPLSQPDRLEWADHTRSLCIGTVDAHSLVSLEGRTTRVEQLPVGVLQNQPSLATILDDAQDRLGISHLAYLLDLEPRSNLSPFARWPAFPTSDYYGDSVALGGRPPEGQSRAALIRHVLDRWRGRPLPLSSRPGVRGQRPARRSPAPCRIARPRRSRRARAPGSESGTPPG
jgi:hypothetical protein